MTNDSGAKHQKTSINVRKHQLPLPPVEALHENIQVKMSLEVLLSAIG